MSKGNPIVKVRIHLDDLAEIVAMLESRNANTREEVWTISDWIRSAIAEKIRKTHAGRKPRVRRERPWHMRTGVQCTHGTPCEDWCEVCDGLAGEQLP